MSTSPRLQILGCCSSDYTASDTLEEGSGGQKWVAVCYNTHRCIYIWPSNIDMYNTCGHSQLPTLQGSTTVNYVRLVGQLAWPRLCAERQKALPLIQSQHIASARACWWTNLGGQRAGTNAFCVHLLHCKGMPGESMMGLRGEQGCCQA